MTDEDMQKKIEFIIEQQAQLVVNQEKAEERMTRMENIVVRLYEDTETRFSAVVDAQLRTEARVGELAQKMGELADAQTRTDSRIGELVAAQTRTDSRIGEMVAAQSRTDSRIGEMAAAQSRADERLSSFIGVVERYVGAGRSGDTQG